MDDATFNRGFPRFTHFPHPRLEILLPAIRSARTALSPLSFEVLVWRIPKTFLTRDTNPEIRSVIVVVEIIEATRALMSQNILGDLIRSGIDACSASTAFLLLSIAASSPVASPSNVAFTFLTPIFDSEGLRFSK